MLDGVRRLALMTRMAISGQLWNRRIKVSTRVPPPSWAGVFITADTDFLKKEIDPLTVQWTVL